MGMAEWRSSIWWAISAARIRASDWWRKARSRSTRIEKLKNDEFGSLEDAARAYLDRQGIDGLAAAAIAVAGIVMEEDFLLTNRDWIISRPKLKARLHDPEAHHPQ